MPDLIAQGPEPHQRWRRRLTENSPLVLGRAAGGWDVPWDDCVSRRHVTLRWDSERLYVAKLEGARNPIFFRGRETERCTVLPGEHFVIGSTSFHVAEQCPGISLDAPPPVTEQAFSAAQLNRTRFRDAEGRIEMLSKLPDIISGSSTEAELIVRLDNLLLNGIPLAQFVAVVRRDSGAKSEAPGEHSVAILHWDSRGPDHMHFSPSARLIEEALRSGKSVVHVWRGQPPATSADFTQWDDLDWAFCTPIAGESTPGWAVYVAGRVSPSMNFDPRDPKELQDDLKFTELAATTFARLRELRRLERRQASLSQFISPMLLERMGDRDPEEALMPREAEVSVLFCDLRGFSRKSEQLASDLMGLLNRVSQALGVMTRRILEQGGVVGDFHGDAAMGFWGWPLAQHDAVIRACRAALAIRAEFTGSSNRGDHALADFRVGIGIATGRAVAGKIGTLDQVKITVFGPVVNLASRLEGLTKLLHAPILIDEGSAKLIRACVPKTEARVRRVARLKPYGLDKPLEVCELLPPAAEYPELSDDNITMYEAALDALLSGNWSLAFSLLHHVPAEDRVKDFLTVFIAQHNRTPPDNWDGVISVSEKY
jgi:adenylate cyclase